MAEEEIKQLRGYLQHSEPTSVADLSPSLPVTHDQAGNVFAMPSVDPPSTSSLLSMPAPTTPASQPDASSVYVSPQSLPLSPVKVRATPPHPYTACLQGRVPFKKEERRAVGEEEEEEGGVFINLHMLFHLMLRDPSTLMIF